MTDDLKPRLEFALDVARKAGELILGYYQSKGLRVETKKDHSPVTVADREAEALIRTNIVREFPGDGAMGGGDDRCIDAAEHAKGFMKRCGHPLQEFAIRCRRIRRKRINVAAHRK